MLSTPSMWSRCTCDIIQLMCLHRLEACVGPSYIMTRFMQALGLPPRTKSIAGWDVTRCSVVDIYRLFLSPCFLRDFTRRWRQRVYCLFTVLCKIHGVIYRTITFVMMSVGRDVRLCSWPEVIRSESPVRSFQSAYRLRNTLLCLLRDQKVL